MRNTCFPSKVILGAEAFRNQPDVYGGLLRRLSTVEVFYLCDSWPILAVNHATSVNQGGYGALAPPLLGFHPNLGGYRAPIAPPFVTEKNLLLCITLKACLRYIAVSDTPATVSGIYLRPRINESNYYDR